MIIYLEIPPDETKTYSTVISPRIVSFTIRSEKKKGEEKVRPIGQLLMEHEQTGHSSFVINQKPTQL